PITGELVTNVYNTISGWFFFSSTPTIQVSPVGGYRIGDTYNVTAYKFDKDNAQQDYNDEIYYYKEDELAEDVFPLGYLHYDISTGKFKEVSYMELSLTDVSYIQYSLGAIAKAMDRNDATATEAKAMINCNIEMKMNKVVLTYFKLEGFATAGAFETDVRISTYTNRYTTVPSTVHFATKIDPNNADKLTLDPTYYESELETPDSIDDFTIKKEMRDRGHGLDSAHNQIYARYAGGAYLEIYGYFDYLKYNPQYVVGATKVTDVGAIRADIPLLVVELIYAAEDGAKYTSWLTNTTTTETGIACGLNSTGVPTNRLDSKIIAFYYDETVNEGPGLNAGAQLDKTNSFIHLVATRSEESELTISEKFYAVSSADNKVAELSYGATNRIDGYYDYDLPIVPMSIVYNTDFIKIGSQTITPTKYNGTETFDHSSIDQGYNSESNIKEAKLSYTFAKHDVASGKKYLTIAISEQYRVVEYKDKVYQFVGFMINNVIETTDMIYSFSDIPSGKLSPVYIQVQKIKIAVNIGGSYSATIKQDSITAAGSVFENKISMTVGAAQVYTKF
ncbi:MAG: hypothetical protein J6J33_02265, partial [Clostridia bacterium]|nr:hypothetical protein [Clostridia bacterium]